MVTKKTGMKKPKPTASSLRRKSGWVMACVAVEQGEDRARDEGAEDGLQPELRGDRREADKQHERAPNADLRGGVLKAQEVGADDARALRPADGKKIAAASSTSAPIRSSVAPMPPSPEKKTDSRMTAPKSAMVPAAITSWPKVERDLAGVLEHRNHHAERGRGEDDRHEQRASRSGRPP